MNYKNKYGVTGEALTADFLRKNGCIIYKRNYQCRFGEIDIIAEKGDLLLFVEVKTRIQNSMVSPADAVDVHKQRRIILTAEDFLSKVHKEYICRFDVCEITVENADGAERYKLNYIKNAFTK